MYATAHKFGWIEIQGARRVATAINDVLSYGNHYQWGRPADGHEITVWNGATPTSGRGFYDATALEALATGNAVVYSNTGGLIDMVDGNGYLIEPNNYNQLAHAILALIKEPNLTALKKQSTQIALKKYHPQIQLTQFIKLMEEVK